MMTKQQVLYPDLCSRLITKQHAKTPLRFFCYASLDYTIELWSNLTMQKKWLAFPFAKLQNNEYQLMLNTFHLPPGDYEFTLRFSCHDGPWSWYGVPNQNGRVLIVPWSPSPTPAAPTFANVPQLRFTAKEQTQVADLWHFETQKEYASAHTTFSLGKINHAIHSYTVLIRKGSCWLTPISGKSNFDKRGDEKWQLILYQDAEQGNTHLWMAVGQKTDCYLSPGPNNTINFHYTPCEDGEEAHLFIASTSKQRHYAHLIKITLDYYKRFIVKQEEEVNANKMELDSIMLDKLGYCTWNAFGKSISAKKLDEALDSLQSNHVHIDYVIIDDGWQAIKNEELISMEANDKFPGGLKRTISQLKSKYPFIKYIGVWHALWGYWLGVNQAFAKENDYGSFIKNGIMANPKKFYHDFYKFLNEAGIDFVKVDNQGAFQDLSIPGFDLWDEYRLAMIESADEFLKSRVIHSMALTPHILFDLILSSRKKSIFRNSDDFFPDEDESHAWHIYANAINSLWTLHSPVVGDWDMFQSDHPFAEYHASSRAISGGPIYITDIPNKHNLPLIQKLIGQTRHHGYTILRSSQAPQPTFETVFGNPMENKSNITLYNIHQENQSSSKWGSNKPEYGVCGFWNSGNQDTLGVVSCELFSSKRLARTPIVAYVVSGPDQGKLALLNPMVDSDEQENDKLVLRPPSSTDSSSSSIHSINSKKSYQLEGGGGGFMSARVKGLGSSLVSLSHVRSLGSMLYIACLGLIDKLNGTKAIFQTSLTRCDLYAIYEARLTHKSSACGFWIKSSPQDERAPQKVVLDGKILKKDMEWTWCKETGLLKVDMMVVPLDIATDNTFCIQIYVG